MIKSNSRRKFLKQTSAVGSASLWVPSFISALQSCESSTDNKPNRLIVIQLAGGLDGLSALVPFQNDIYYRLRPNTSISKDEITKITDNIAINNQLWAFENFYNDGDLAVLHNVGYPNPDRSHFRSSDIWHTGSNTDEYWKDGWIGRLVERASEKSNQLIAVEIGDILSRVMKGKTRNGFCISDSHDLLSTLPRNLYDKSLANFIRSSSDGDSLDFLYETALSSYESITYLHRNLRSKSVVRPYQQTEFATQLTLISHLIQAQTETRVYYVSHSGFDTHAGQKNAIKWPLKVYNDALYALVNDLKKSGDWENTMIMTFSEFGRRVQENNSQGTDHGAANCMFIMSGGLKRKGILNQLISLDDLINGDLKYEIDFRRVYATLLENWLEIPSKEILRNHFSKLDFI